MGGRNTVIGTRCGPYGDIYVLSTGSNTYMRHMGRRVESSGRDYSYDARLSASAGFDTHQGTSWSFRPL
jgi:hypothetical protein